MRTGIFHVFVRPKILLLPPGLNGLGSASPELWIWAFLGILWDQWVFNERGSFKVFPLW